jgi:hypothetical protein
MEILSGQTLLAGSAARTAHPNPPAGAPDHATLLNKAEKRLLAEWMDLGGQYYNDPFAPGGGVRAVTALSLETFEQQVYPILRSTCMGACHQPGGTNIAASFRGNRLVLTGDAEGDYNVTLTMVNDACAPANNLLLQRPSTVPHPAGATTQTTALLPAGSAPYTTIANWIARGCPNP